MTVVSIFQRGFSLVEAIIVIAVSGIMLAAVALFLRWPFQSYLEASRHSQISDVIDTALRRMGRDLRIALPNSIRVAAGPPNYCLEMLPTVTGGRYRAAVDNNGNGNILDFTIADNSFDMFGAFSAVPGQAPVAGELVVVYNLGPGVAGADAYSGTNTATIQSAVFPDPTPNAPANEALITLQTPTRFPLASPNNRFQVINGPVSYVCTPGPLDPLGNATGTLTRVFGYGIAPAQACPPAGGTSTVLANNVSSCLIQYFPVGPTDTTSRESLTQLQLGVTLGNDAVSMYDEIHISNAP